MNTTTKSLMAAASAGLMTAKSSDRMNFRAVDQITKSRSGTNTSSRDSFDSALNRAQTAKDSNPAPTAAQDNAQPASTTVTDPSTKDVKPDDKDGGINQAKDKTGAKDDVNRKDTKKPAGKDSGKEDDKDETASEPVNNAAVNLNALLLALAGNAGVQSTETAAALSLTAKAGTANFAAIPTDTQTTDDTQTTVKTGALEALLPQNAAAAAQAAQNQQLLDMLSGTTAGKAMTPLAEPMAAGPELTQLATAKLSADRQAAGTKGDAAAATANAPEKETAAVLTVGMPIAATKVLADSTAALTEERDAGSFWQGIPLKVENRGEVNANGQQAGGDMLKKQPEAPTMVLPQADGKAVQEGTQLPEEAQFDRVVVQAAGTSDAASQAAVQAGSYQPSPALTVANPAAAAAEAEPPSTNYDIPKQIVEQAKLIRSVEDTQMIIKLKPEHLGELTLKVSVGADGAVNASFHSDNAQVRGLIEGSMVQLKQELQAQGLKVDNVSVNAGLSQDFFGESQAGQQGYPQQTARSRQLDQAAFAEDAEQTSQLEMVLPASTPTAAAAGVDYRV
jgi:flagellar hook-length control protein FliK